MYVRDDVADEVVRKHKAIQSHIRGQDMMLWLPGMGAGVAAQACLMFGEIGIAVAIMWLGPLTVESFKYYIGGLMLGSLPMALLFNAVVRGVSVARTYMFRLSLVQVLVAAGVVFASLVYGGKPSIGASIVGFVLSLIALRLIAGPSYALLAAIYRAQRRAFGTCQRV